MAPGVESAHGKIAAELVVRQHKSFSGQEARPEQCQHLMNAALLSCSGVQNICALVVQSG